MSRTRYHRGLGRRTLEQAAELLRAVSHPDRLKLIERLSVGDAPVRELAGELKLPHAVVSQHLNYLRLHGILARKRQGREMHYRLHDVHLVGLLEWIRKREYAEIVVEDGAAI